MSTSPSNTTYYCHNKGLLQHPLASHFFANKLQSSLKINKIPKNGGVTGWGYKASGRWAKKIATQEKRKKQSFLLLEDGFVRSLLPGYQHGTVYSLIADSRGIYFDATGESDLIHFLNGDSPAPSFWPSEPTPAQAEKILQKIKEQGISKYNGTPSNENKPPQEQGVLVIDQTKGDAAIQYGGINASDYDKMLQDALEENPDETIYVKTHPDHHHLAKKSCFTTSLLDHPRIKILPANLSAAESFKWCKKVYVGTSLMGMEALIHDCEVITYGWNFYAGWGLTTDRSNYPKPPRKKKLTLLELFTAAYLRYTHYLDPDTKKICDLERIIDHIKLQHQHWQQHSTAYASYGLSLWKKYVLPCYTYPSQPLIQTKSTSKISKTLKKNPDAHLFLWGKKTLPITLKKTHQSNKITRIEDGFLRSRGLGANFNFPLSWVFDNQGIYFDATTPSRLEHILETENINQKTLNQAKKLQQFLTENKLTKYNLGIENAELPTAAKGKKIILIPGQVDSDASITYGSPKLRNNKELLAEVRRQNPEAFICYKPHPDLLAAARKDAPLWKNIEQEADHIIHQGDIISWIQTVDEIHTLTSTVGFEALLHHKPVFTYGLPFYAGWGLTTDWLKTPRRTKKRTLDELIAAAYILYPTYYNPKSREFTTALATAKILANTEFSYDSRPLYLKILGDAKSYFYRLIRKTKQN